MRWCRRTAGTESLIAWSTGRLCVRRRRRITQTRLAAPRSIDPIVLVKLMIAAALEGIGSTRELCRIAGLRLDLRRFLGYGFHERLPVHQTLSHAQTRRFV